MRRTIPAFAALIALSQPATAGVPLFGHVSCALVRFYVAKYSETAAERWARSHGASDADIETARHCLHGANVQTAAQDRHDRVSQVPTPATEQVRAPASEQRRAHDEPAERNPDQEALQVASVQEQQRAEPAQDSRDGERGVRGIAVQANYEIKDPAPSGGKTASLRVGGAASAHRASKMRGAGPLAWLKRQFDHLVRPRQFRIAFLSFHGSRR
jgi:hypothetical protein